jgi:predicted RNA-binding Zn ribbon-like protein
MDTLWIELANSMWHDWRGSGASEDRLDRPGWLDDWMAERGLPPVAARTETDLGELKRFRDELRRWAVLLVEGEELSESDLKTLNEALSASAFTKSVLRTNTDVVLTEQPLAASAGYAALLAAAAASFAETLTKLDRYRVRICENKDCKWVFYDDTKNRSKRFCEDSMCGNLMKVRRFRERKKGQEQKDH